MFHFLNISLFDLGVNCYSVKGQVQLQQKLGKTIIDTQTYICIPNLINFKRSPAFISASFEPYVFVEKKTKFLGLLFVFVLWSLTEWSGMLK